jgi:hypothetical protein
MERLNASRSWSGMTCSQLVDGLSPELKERSFEAVIRRQHQANDAASGSPRTIRGQRLFADCAIGHSDEPDIAEERQPHHHRFTAQTFELEAPRTCPPVANTQIKTTSKSSGFKSASTGAGGRMEHEERVRRRCNTSDFFVTLASVVWLTNGVAKIVVRCFWDVSTHARTRRRHASKYVFDTFELDWTCAYHELRPHACQDGLTAPAVPKIPRVQNG